MSLSVAVAACGGVDDPPLGGPFGGTTDPTGPNGGNGDNTDNSNTNNDNNNQSTGDDAGTTQTQDSGTTQTQDSGTTQTKDSGTQTQDSGSQTQSAPTWTQVFNNYLKSGTKGKCSSCHSQGNSASSLYTWLKGRGYISGSGSALVDANQSCLSWYGGNMPTNGPSSYAQAVTDMNAWAAAGAQNN
ncbi:MAG TPA: hypothetical protein VGH28_26260 [Polyangiaceae bacterium]